MTRLNSTETTTARKYSAYLLDLNLPFQKPFSLVQKLSALKINTLISPPCTISAASGLFLKIYTCYSESYYPSFYLVW